MPISNELFLSILAMDAYNCGYNATVGEALTGLPGNQIGNATICRDINLPEGSQSASFYAQAYTWNGRTIISYRGTDGLLFNSVPTDIPDWGIWFADNYNTGQARLAADFYRLVAQTVTPSTIETTGHSLGGALAGFVASLYGRKGTLFDNIGFEGAVNRLLTETGTTAEETAGLQAAREFYFGSTATCSTCGPGSTSPKIR